MQKKIVEGDREIPGFLRKRYPFKILATLMIIAALYTNSPSTWSFEEITACLQHLMNTKEEVLPDRMG
jgi:hypothetical protein